MCGVRLQRRWAGVPGTGIRLVVDSNAINFFCAAVAGSGSLPVEGIPPTESAMASTSHPILRHARRWLDRSRPAESSDAELVRRFANDKDELAFAELVDRHGPMVLAVAGRAVGDYQTAEDVFQATFLALARRADRLRRPEALPGWLHRTAHHLGLHAARARARRQRAEANTPAPRPAGPPDLDARELLAILDVELARLPDRLRLPLVLCCLEGLTQDEAAARLGWSPGSVKGRLERGRRPAARPTGPSRSHVPGGSRGGAPGFRDGCRRGPVARCRDPGGHRAGRYPVRGSPGFASDRSGDQGQHLVCVSRSPDCSHWERSRCWAGKAQTRRRPRVHQPRRDAELPADRLPEGAVARLGWSPHSIGSSSFALTAG